MKFGKCNHYGIVVEDIEKAKEEYSKVLGIKKWYRLNASPFEEFKYKGENRDCEVTLYFGGKGTTKLELIQTRGDSNYYTDFYEKNGEAIHHVMFNTKNLDKTIEEMKQEGYEPIQTAKFKSAGATIRYAYMTKKDTAVTIELIETTIMGFIKKGDMPFEMQLGVITGNYKRVK